MRSRPALVLATLSVLVAPRAGTAADASPPSPVAADPGRGWVVRGTVTAADGAAGPYAAVLFPADGDPAGPWRLEERLALEGGARGGLRSVVVRAELSGRDGATRVVVATVDATGVRRLTVTRTAPGRAAVATDRGARADAAPPRDVEAAEPLLPASAALVGLAARVPALAALPTTPSRRVPVDLDAVPGDGPAALALGRLADEAFLDAAGLRVDGVPAGGRLVFDALPAPTPRRLGPRGPFRRGAVEPEDLAVHLAAVGAAGDADEVAAWVLAPRVAAATSARHVAPGDAAAVVPTVLAALRAPDDPDGGGAWRWGEAVLRGAGRLDPATGWLSVGPALRVRCERFGATCRVVDLQAPLEARLDPTVPAATPADAVARWRLAHAMRDRALLDALVAWGAYADEGPPATGSLREARLAAWTAAPPSVDPSPAALADALAALDLQARSERVALARARVTFVGDVGGIVHHAVLVGDGWRFAGWAREPVPPAPAAGPAGR